MSPGLAEGLVSAATEGNPSPTTQASFGKRRVL